MSILHGRQASSISRVLIGILFTGSLSAAPRPGLDKAEELTLAAALGKASRNNPTLYARRLTQELKEIDYDNAWAKMWLPKISLSATASSPYTVAQLPGSAARAGGTTSWNHGTPTAGTFLNVGQYTLYNFGRDRDSYDISRLEVERSRQNVREVERQVRYEVISAVFNFKTQQDLLDISQRSVNAAQALHGLLRNRAQSGRATSNDLASIEIDLLNAKNTLISVQTAYSQSLWALNIVLGDPLDHPYVIKGGIKYIKFRMNLEDVVRVFKENAPLVREARKNLEQARLTMKLAHKNSLPLPSITFSGLTMGSSFGGQGSQAVRTTTSSVSGNLDISAQLNFTIPLVGDGGFLNARTIRAAEVTEELAELDLRNAGNFGEAAVRGLYTQVLQTESTIENNEKLFKDSLHVFEAALSAVQSKANVNRLDFKDAIRQLRESELAFTQSVLDHYNFKLQLANTIGVDRFPEENL